jgi:hypothetical protein
LVMGRPGCRPGIMKVLKNSRAVRHLIGSTQRVLGSNHIVTHSLREMGKAEILFHFSRHQPSCVCKVQGQACHVAPITDTHGSLWCWCQHCPISQMREVSVRTLIPSRVSPGSHTGAFWAVHFFTGSVSFSQGPRKQSRACAPV